MQIDDRTKEIYRDILKVSAHEDDTMDAIEAMALLCAHFVIRAGSTDPAFIKLKVESVYSVFSQTYITALRDKPALIRKPKASA